MDDPTLRLRQVPWGALEGLVPAVAEALEPVLAGAPAERALDKLLRAHREWTATQRAAVAEALFGVALWRRRLGPEREPAVLIGLLARDLGGFTLPGLTLPPPHAPESLAERYSFPDWIAQALGNDEPLLAALCVPGPVVLRANAARISRDELRSRLEGLQAEPGRWAPHALVVRTPRPNLYGLAALREGLFEVQDEGSQLLGELVQAQPGETVLDACAGAGGKSLQLAAAGARVLCADPDLERLSRLRIRAARAGARVEVLGAAAPDGLLVDRVLVDAPCSELGALRRGPDVRWRLREDDARALPALQLAILRGAARHVRPGGRLVYATCTLREEENEGVARAFEQLEPAFQAVAPALPASFVQGQRFVARPDRHGTDGFFAALWQRAAC